MSSKIHLRNKAIELRKTGKSYSEILKVLQLSSKGTLSFWFKDIKLSPQSRQLLKKNNDLAIKRGLRRFNLERSRRIVKENENARVDGATEIGKISQRELLLVGASLYW